MASLPENFIRLYKQVQADWQKGSGKYSWIVPLNEALEKVCRENSRRADAAHVYAKVRLINRAYNANLERNGNVDWPEMEVAKAFANKADPIMRPLRSIRQLDRDTLQSVVACHTKLMDVARKATKTWTVSFCSKYLSFHFPDVAPVYDSSAYGWAKELVRAPDETGFDSSVLDHDYGRHCLRVLWLLERLQKVGVKHPHLRVVDFVLYSALEDAMSL